MILGTVGYVEKKIHACDLWGHRSRSLAFTSPKVYYAFPARKEGNPWPEVAAHGKRSVGRAIPYFHCPGTFCHRQSSSNVSSSAKSENSPIAVGRERRRSYSLLYYFDPSLSPPFFQSLLWMLFSYFSGPIRFFESLITLTVASDITYLLLPIEIITYCFFDELIFYYK